MIAGGANFCARPSSEEGQLCRCRSFTSNIKLILKNNPKVIPQLSQSSWFFFNWMVACGLGWGKYLRGGEGWGSGEHFFFIGLDWLVHIWLIDNKLKTNIYGAGAGFGAGG